MQELHNLSRRGGSLIRVVAAAAVLLAGSHGYANILWTSATVRANSFLVDVQVTTGATVERVSITYQTTGVDPWFPASPRSPPPARPRSPPDGAPVSARRLKGLKLKC
jgi:hypothetical protein